MVAVATKNSDGVGNHSGHDTDTNWILRSGRTVTSGREHDTVKITVTARVIMHNSDSHGKRKSLVIMSAMEKVMPILTKLLQLGLPLVF